MKSKLDILDEIFENISKETLDEIFEEVDKLSSCEITPEEYFKYLEE